MADGPPIWLLDIDGVINIRKSPWHTAPHNGRAHDNGREWKIRWAPQLVAHIRTLHKSGTVEILWCTTWCSNADQMERLFKLPALGRAFTEELHGAACSDAKLAAARTVLAEGRRLIWTDDVEVPTEHSEPDLYAELTAGGRGLLIRPRERDGLRPEHLDLIHAFLAAPAGRS